ncbi:MAG: DUF294 nucleotidyltransferase-like domain-containing protein [Motiliproteus sp.]
MIDSSLLPNVRDFIAQLYPFNRLPASLLEQVSTSIQISYLEKGEWIRAEQLSEGCLYIIRSGAIEEFENNGELRARLDQGEIFGFTKLIDPSLQRFKATALENTLLYMLPGEKFHELSDDPAFSAYFAPQSQERLRSALQHTQTPDDALLMQNVLQVCNRHTVEVSPDCPIQETAQRMSAIASASALIIEDEHLIGLVTNRDLTKRVVASGIDVNLPVSEVMTPSPSTVELTDSVLHSISKMMQLGIQVLPVMQGSTVVGVINACDLVQKHGAQAIYLIDAIQRQDSVDLLVELMPQRQRIFEALVEHETRPDHVGKVMTMIADALTVRLLQLAEISLLNAGAGAPPCAYAWMATGSQARFELQLVSDQDNALVLSRSATPSDRVYFQQLADIVCQDLAACGYSLCPGDVMASNPLWCQPLHVWEQYYRQWITLPELKALLNVSIFLDTRCIYGEESFVHELQMVAAKLVKGNRRFIAALTANCTKISPPIGFFRNFVLVKGGDNKNTFNIKKRAVSLIVDVARIYGLLANCLLPSTTQRLQYAVDQGVLHQASHDDLYGAYRFVCSVRQRHQLQALKAGNDLNNHLHPKSMSHFERSHLKDAFRVIASTQEVVTMAYSINDERR